jgi:membrane fusion protein (multidrug efflux system)
VVQRVPVRVALDAQQLRDHPLRVGLSMEAVVDVSKQDGKTLADAPRAASVSQTQAFNTQDDGAEAEVRRVILGNSGASPRVMANGGPPARP